MKVFSEPPLFIDFLNEVDKSMYENLTARDAVKILKKVFDPVSESSSETKRRPMLILVDEISKSKDDKEVMTQLGAVLDEFDDVNIVVSSLSPGYVEELVTGSNRPVEFVILSPLLDAKLGSKECLEWANATIASAYKKTKKLIRSSAM